MAHGGSRPNSGRRRGTKNRYSKELAEKMKARGCIEPLDGLLMVGNDPTASTELRVLAWSKAAPYVHRRKPVEIEVASKFEYLTPEARARKRDELLAEIRARVAQPERA